MISGRIARAEDEALKTPKPTSAMRKPSGSYCGVACLYAVIKLTGQAVDFRELIKPKYIGFHQGSSLVELQKAARDYELYALPVGKLTIQILRHSPYPIILHVKSDPNIKRYNHYELFLGIQDDKARLFNPPELVRLVPFYKLAPRWDGNGLIVSAEPIDVGTVFASARKRLLLYVVVGIAVILILHWAKQRWPLVTLVNSRSKLLGLSIAQSTGLAIAALLCGMIYHFANDEGFLAHPNATASIQQAHLGNFIPKVTKKQVNRLLNEDTVFIDARYQRDYQAGHMEGAISVPVDANDTQRHKAMADIAKDTHIVVYCQSVGCKFAEKVAIKLKADGFSNTSIFKGGWLEWKKEDKNNDQA